MSLVGRAALAVTLLSASTAPACSSGVSGHMGGGLGLRASDLARIGYLVLRKGKWGDRQIVSESWIRESTAHHVRNPRTLGSHPTDYGYLVVAGTSNAAGFTGYFDPVDFLYTHILPAVEQ